MSNKKPKIKTLVTLEAGDCRWPIGDPRQEGFHFCGAQQAIGRPYCIEHWALAFVPGKARQHPGAQQPSLPALTARKAA